MFNKYLLVKYKKGFKIYFTVLKMPFIVLATIFGQIKMCIRLRFNI
jgi:hypothetical protein